MSSVRILQFEPGTHGLPTVMVTKGQRWQHLNNKFLMYIQGSGINKKKFNCQRHWNCDLLRYSIEWRWRQKKYWLFFYYLLVGYLHIIVDTIMKGLTCCVCWSIEMNWKEMNTMTKPTWKHVRQWTWYSYAQRARNAWHIESKGTVQN